MCLIVVSKETTVWCGFAAERETSLLIRVQAELMTSLVGLNEALRPSLMIILRANWEKYRSGEKVTASCFLQTGICRGLCEASDWDRRQIPRSHMLSWSFSSLTSEIIRYISYKCSIAGHIKKGKPLTWNQSLEKDATLVTLCGWQMISSNYRAETRFFPEEQKP